MGRGHRIIKDQNLVDEFEEWINSYELNRLFGEPQKKVHSCVSCSHNTEIK